MVANVAGGPGPKQTDAHAAVALTASIDAGAVFAQVEGNVTGSPLAVACFQVCPASVVTNTATCPDGLTAMTHQSLAVAIETEDTSVTAGYGYNVGLAVTTAGVMKVGPARQRVPLSGVVGIGRRRPRRSPCSSGGGPGPA